MNEPPPPPPRSWRQFSLPALFALTAMAAVLAMIWSNIRRLGDEPTKDVRVMIYVVLAMMALPLAMSIAIGARAVMTWRKPPSRRRDSRRP